MPARVRVLAVLCVFVLISIVFTVIFIQRQSAMKSLDERYSDALSYHQYLENKENSLRETLAALGTDAFIENIARTQYGYMKSDELRFVITNTDVLYGTQESPAP